MSTSKHFNTLAIHVGSEPDEISGAVVPPISLATTFAQADLGQQNGKQSANSHGKGYEYGRTGNPTRGAFERAIAAVEYGKYCCAFASGLAATNTLLQTLAPGEHCLVIDDVYGGTQRLFRNIIAVNSAVNFSFVDMTDLANVAAGITPQTKLIWIETPTNPTLKLCDIQEVVAIAAKYNDGAIRVCVDNTFFSPYLQNPLVLGAHIVVHSVTKYIGGHSDVVMGVVITSDDDLHTRLRYLQNAVGAVPSPFDCYMALRGLKTLHVRMEYAMSNALAIASYLEGHDKVEKVVYPGLPSHPQHELMKKQAKGGGAIITFYVKGGIEQSSAFLKNLQLFLLAESLGAVESLAECPAVMTHASVPADKRVELGISDNLIRLSIGIEHVDDLKGDLAQALDHVTL